MKQTTGSWVLMASDAIRWARRNALAASLGLGVVGLIVLAIECAGVLAIAGYVRPLDGQSRLFIVGAVVATGLVVTAIAKAVQASYGQVADGALDVTWYTPGDCDIVYVIGVMIATGGVWLLWNATADVVRHNHYTAADRDHAAQVLGVLIQAGEAQPTTSLPPPRGDATLVRSLRMLTDLGLADISTRADRAWATSDAYRHARTMRERTGDKSRRAITIQR